MRKQAESYVKQSDRVGKSFDEKVERLEKQLDKARGSSSDAEANWDKAKSNYDALKTKSQAADSAVTSQEAEVDAAAKNTKGGENFFGRNQDAQEVLDKAESDLTDSKAKLSKLSKNEEIYSSEDLKPVEDLKQKIELAEEKLATIKSNMVGGSGEEAKKLTAEINKCQAEIEGYQKELKQLYDNPEGIYNKASKEVLQYLDGMKDYFDHVGQKAGVLADELTSIGSSKFGLNRSFAGSEAYSDSWAVAPFEFVGNLVLDLIPIGIWGYKAFKAANKASSETVFVQEVKQNLESQTNIFAYGLATPIAYSIGKVLSDESMKSKLKELGFIVKGEVPTESSNESLVDDGAFSDISPLFSKSAENIAKELEEQMGGLSKIPGLKGIFGKASDEKILKIMESELKDKIENILVGMALKYDAGRTEEARKDVQFNIEQYRAGASDRKDLAGNVGKYSGGLTALTLGVYAGAAIATGPFGMIGAALIGGGIGGLAGGVGGKLGLEALSAKKTESNVRQGSARDLKSNIKSDPNFKKEVSRLIAVIKTEVKKAKKLQDNKMIFHKSSLSSLLFENILLESKLSGEDVKKKLKASGLSIYSFMDQRDSNFKNAESDFVSSIGLVLEEFFGVKVDNIDPNAARSIESQAVIGQTVDTSAQPGQQSSSAVQQNMTGMPMPYNAQQPITNPAQIPYAMSYAGGQNMSELVKLVQSQNEDYKALVSRVLDEKMNISDVSKELANIKGTNFSELEKSMETGLNEINSDKPTLSKDTVKKIYNTFRKSNIESKIENIEGVELFKINSNYFLNPDRFTELIKTLFNYTDSEVTYGDKIEGPVKRLFEQLIEDIKLKDDAGFKPDDIIILLVQKLLEKNLDISKKKRNIGVKQKNRVKDDLSDDVADRITAPIDSLEIKSESFNKNKLVMKNYYKKSLSSLLFEVKSMSARDDKNVESNKEIDLQSEWRKLWNIK